MPIDAHLPRILAEVERASSVVLVAEPGAGKTTRVPWALHEAGMSAAGQIMVLQPRRIAARLAAARVATEHGEAVGQTVGYQVRFQRMVGPQTRIQFVTEGIMLRQLLDAPCLPGVSVVVLDEFHERSLHADVLLGLVRRLQRGERPDLKLIVMSATLAAEAIASYLDCEVLRVPGAPFEVALEYVDGGHKPLEEQVAQQVRRVAAADGASGRGASGMGVSGLHPGGDVLVFLPGAAEIRRTQQACQAICAQAEMALSVLHGDLPLEAQTRALTPGGGRKLILSTNIAETSLTIEGVRTVIDSGLARMAGHSPWSGLPTLATVPISRASATQRAGRAGRLGPGRCVRLYGKHDHDSRPAFDAPEIARADLSEVWLTLASLPDIQPATLELLEPAPSAAVMAAQRLLRQLGALDGDGQLTELGRRMVALPLHPRLARLALEAAGRGFAAEGATLAALVGEREIWVPARCFDQAREGRRLEVGSCDLFDRLERLEAVEAEGLRPATIRAHDLDVTAVQAVVRARDQLLRALGRNADRRSSRGAQSDADGASSNLDREATLRWSLLSAFGDRVARRRAGSDTLVMAGGGSAQLSPMSVVRDADFVVVVDAAQRSAAGGAGRPGSGVHRGGGQVGTQARRVVAHQVSSIEPDWLLDQFPREVESRSERSFDAVSERVVALERLTYAGLVLDESRVPAAPDDETASVLYEALCCRGIETLMHREGVDSWLARVRFAAMHTSDVPVLDSHEVDAASRRLCEGRTSVSELRQASLLQALQQGLTPAQRANVARMAPEHVTIAGRRQSTVNYPPDQDPWIASRLQDFFGMAEGPCVAGGRVPLVLHLLAPNRRAVQVTTDLAGFWRVHYPALRKQLMRRYPKHAWPEDPTQAAPGQPSPRR